MTRPMCPLCLKRKEKKLKKDIIEAKKKTKEAERQKEKTRRELTQLQQNYATIESYWNARRARGEIMLSDADLLAEGERMRNEERISVFDNPWCAIIINLFLNRWRIMVKYEDGHSGSHLDFL